MKTKKIIIQILVIFLLSISFFFTKNTYAVWLKYEAEITEGGKKAIIRTHAKSSKNQESGWKDISSESVSGSTSGYSSNGLAFNGKCFATCYPNSTNIVDTNKYLCRYDKTSGSRIYASGDPISSMPSYSLSSHKDVSNVRTSDVDPSLFDTNLDFKFNFGDGYAYKWRSRVDKPSGYDFYIKTTDIVITKAGIDRLLEEYEKKDRDKYVFDDELVIMFSITNHTLINNIGTMDTGYDAITKLHGNINALNLGTDEKQTVGASILNHYDNYLYIPLAKLRNRTLTVVHKVKDSNGNWQVEKTESDIKLESTNAVYEKLDIGTNNKWYIGGKMSKGATKEKAKENISSSTDTWGWNTTKKEIPDSTNEEHYYIELYYDYRDISEYHLDAKGNTIYSGWNKKAKDFKWPLTKDSITLNAKSSPFYYNYNKYVYLKTITDGTESTNKTVLFDGLDGGNKLIFGDKHTVKFYYEYEPPRQVFVRHFVYNESTNKYERSTILTNSNAAIKDYYDNKWYLRKNGYNQRHVKDDIISSSKKNVNYVDNITAGFNEQYTIDYNDSIKLDKSRTIENEGVKYEYQGYKVQNDTIPNVLTTKSQASTLQTNKIVTISAAKKTKTYVDFYYIQTVIPPPGDGAPDDLDNVPTIDFIPKNENNNNIGKNEQEADTAKQTGNCRIAYVPSGEKLKSYITAITYRPYSIVYEGSGIDVSTGAISYTLVKYDTYKYVDGLIKNNDSSNYGYINSTEKKGVFNTNSNTKVNPIANNIDNVVKASRSVVKNLNPNAASFVVNDGRKTTEADYGNDNIHQVNYDKYNGIRNPSGTAYYDIVSLVENGSDVYKVKKENVAVNTKNNAQVNVFTPAKINQIKVESENMVNHSNKDNSVIQKNSKFTVNLVPDTQTEYYKNINDVSKYIKYYWLVADFDIQLLNNQEVYNKDTNQVITISSGQIVRKGTLIKISKNDSFSGIATNESGAGDIINQFSNKIKAVAVTWNVTDEQFEKEILKEVKITDSIDDHIDSGKISKVLSNCELASTNKNHKDIVRLQVSDMYDDAHYFVELLKTSVNIGRVYDFKVTDCLDVDFKNVFRKSNLGNVNDLRGIKYFSGVRRLLVYGGSGMQLGSNQENKNNIFEDRETADNTINSVPSKTILPLGPYKHVEKNYIQAPKLGYRISFDLKTSGVYTKNTGNNKPQRYIKITPSYYYISKDGNTFKENIELYYKNSSGKYVGFAGSGYTIYFKPNDGYRTVYNPEAPALKDMSTKLEALKIGGTSTDYSFKLTDDMMSYSDNNFVQAWYGEFKLPNSTIAVEVDSDGKKDINNPLKDGYIGVRFNIQCIDKEKASSRESDATIISYNQNDKCANPSINTTQWDYEGYLGFARTNIGKNLQGELRLQLEKDLWNINSQEMYNKVKGTVVLYDIDNRAANDFD